MRERRGAHDGEGGLNFVVEEKSGGGRAFNRRR